MALFSRKPKKEEETPKAVAKESKVAPVSTNFAHRVLISPRITEKATNVNEGNVYTFDVAKRANKTQIEKAIEELYKVRPRKVRIVNILGKKVTHKGKRGNTAAFKKAYVYL